MHTDGIKLGVAVAVACAGAFFAFRTLHRPAPSRSDVSDTITEDPVRVAAAAHMESLDAALRAPTREELSTTLGVIREMTRFRAATLAPDDRFRPEQARALGTSFQSRLAYLLGGDFDENASELAALGWPMPDEERFEQRRAIWEQHRRNEPPAPISVDDIQIRRVSAEMLDEPGGLRREGFGVTSMQHRSTHPYYDYEGQDLVEAVIPMRTTDVTGRPTATLVGFVFAWDDADGFWRPIRSVLFHADDEAGGIPTPDIF